MTDIEADDRRKHKYSNIQHPFYLKPEFLLMGIAGLISTAVVSTLWFTSALGEIDTKANKNALDIEHIEEMQAEQHMSVENELEEIKDSQKELKHEMKDGFKDVGSKLDKIIDRELKRNGH